MAAIKTSKQITSEQIIMKLTEQNKQIRITLLGSYKANNIISELIHNISQITAFCPITIHNLQEAQANINSASIKLIANSKKLENKIEEIKNSLAWAYWFIISSTTPENGTTTPINTNKKNKKHNPDKAQAQVEKS